jgi:hypothetical protein
VDPIATDPKNRVVGVTVIGSIPVPVKLTFRGLPVPLSVIVNVALKAVAAEGVNVTLIVQLDVAARDIPQLLVWLYAGRLVAILLIASADV